MTRGNASCTTAPRSTLAGLACAGTRLDGRGEEAELEDGGVAGSLALESASALLGPERDRFSGVSTGGAEELYPRLHAPELQGEQAAGASVPSMRDRCASAPL